MHTSFEIADADIIQLSKKSSNDPNKIIRFRLPLDDLRLVADQTGEAFDYVLRLYLWLIQSRYDTLNPLMSKTILMGNGEPPPLPNRPPKPRMLEAIPEDRTRQP